jgi:glucosamine--fructose-6-phosphate aminotransferase (isomerizing)
VTLNWNADQIEKKGYSHFMLKEIYEQPHAVSDAMAPHLDAKNWKVKLKNVGFGGVATHELENLDADKDWQKTVEVLKNIERIFIVACGTSFYAGQVGKYLIEAIAQVPVEVEIASEFRYRKPILPPKTLVMTISQSGETADTLAAIRLAKERGCQTLSICNVKNSSIDREAHGHLYMNSGPEVGVASTKAFVSTLTLLNLFAAALGQIKATLSPAKEKEQVEALQRVPSQIEAVLAYDKYFAEASE